MYYKKIKKSKNYNKRIIFFYEEGFPYPLDMIYLESEKDMDIEFNNWVSNQEKKTYSRLTLDKLIICYELMIDCEYAICKLYHVNKENSFKLKQHFDEMKKIMAHYTLLCLTMTYENIVGLLDEADFDSYEYRKHDFLELFLDVTQNDFMKVANTAQETIKE